ncbi:MAG: hypothetical protein M3Y33_00700 [Actinomycetota bacterium]|nr:hypothetical protein [Actinomycetota bacterium]
MSRPVGSGRPTQTRSHAARRQRWFFDDDDVRCCARLRWAVLHTPRPGMGRRAEQWLQAEDAAGLIRDG